MDLFLAGFISVINAATNTTLKKTKNLNVIEKDFTLETVELDLDLPLVVIDLPLSVTFKNGYKMVTFKLNLNDYSTTHYEVRAKAKKAYDRLLIKTLSKIKPIGDGPFVFSYKYWHPNKHGFDTSNPSCIIDDFATQAIVNSKIISTSTDCCIIDKFACDSIVKAGIIPDDTYREVRKVMYESAGISKKNPRCELSITRFNP